MQILPRSRRGTWLLAGAVWVAACAGWWWVLPPAPRAVMHLPKHCELIDFGPSDHTAVVERLDATGNPLSLDLIEIPSGRNLVSYPEAARLDYRVGVSADRQIWLYSKSEPNSDTRLTRFHLETGASLQLGCRIKQKTGGWNPVEVSEDCRWCGYVDPQSDELVIWDILADRQHARLAGLGAKFAFAPNGRSVVASSNDTPLRRVHVVDLETLLTRAIFDVPHVAWGADVDHVRLSDNGDFVIAETATTNHIRGEVSSCCWKVDTGQLLHRGSVAFARFCRGENKFVGSVDDSTIQWIRLDTGQTFHSEPTEFMNPWHISPDRRTVVLPYKTSEVGLLESLARRFGFTWLPTSKEKAGVRFFESSTGRSLGELPPKWTPVYPIHMPWVAMTIRWSADGKTIAVSKRQYDPDHDGLTEIWDIPPRRSRNWFAAGAAMLALPIVLVGRRRVRKLRAA